MSDPPPAILQSLQQPKKDTSNVLAEDLFGRLPDDVLRLIISLLPIQDAAKYRRVRKRWLTVITIMLEPHLQKNAPILLTEYTEYADNGKSKLHLFLNWWSDRENRAFSYLDRVYTRLGFPYLTQCIGSGCLVRLLQGSYEFQVLNLSFGYKIRMTFPKTLCDRIEAYAVFFQPECGYCILFGVASEDNDRVVEYYMLTKFKLDFDSCEMVIVEPASNRQRQKYPSKAAVLVNGSLYRLLRRVKPKDNNDIMEFNIKDGKFRLISLSMLPNYERNYDDFGVGYDGVDLLNIGGVLSLFMVYLGKKNLVCQWNLDDHGNWISFNKYKINSWVSVSMAVGVERVRVIALAGEELLIQMAGRLIRIHLTRDTSTIVYITRSGYGLYPDDQYFWPFGMTAASLEKFHGKTIRIQDTIKIKDVPGNEELDRGGKRRNFEEVHGEEQVHEEQQVHGKEQGHGKEEVQGESSTRGFDIERLFLIPQHLCN